MSFFGFDTTLPSASAGPSSSSLDAKLAALGEDIHIYDFGALEEGADELNDETFGGGDAEKNRDFDFVGSTSRLAVNDAAPAARPAFGGSSGLDYDPLLGPARRGVASSASPAPARPAQKSLAEIEAELRSQSQAKPSPRPPQPKTLAEIEADMRAMQQQRAAQQPSQPQPGQYPPGFPPQQQQPRQPPPAPQQFPPGIPPALLQRLPPNFQMLPPQQQQQIFAHAHHTYMLEQQQQSPRPPPPQLAQQSEQQRIESPAQPLPPQPPRMQPPPPLPGSMFPPLAGHAQSPIPPPPQPISELQRLYHQREEIAKLGNEDLLKQLEGAIREQEALEEKAKRRNAKIALMSHDNGIMSRSDKDFITRIQVSQLVNSAGPQGSHDPYHDDFYYHVYRSIRASRAGAGAKTSVQNAPAGALASKQAMKKMASAVQRLVDDSRKRNKAGSISLNGALGKIATRGPVPRAALTLKPEDMLSTQRKAGNLPLPETSASASAPPALSRRAALMALEQLYLKVLAIEQLRRSSPQLASVLDPTLAAVMAPVVPEDADEFNRLRGEVWTNLRVMDPLDGRDPHPFVSLITPIKGKRLVPRVLRQTTAQESLTLLTLLVATFETLDVVRLAPLIDDTLPPSAPAEHRQAQADANTSIEVFMSTIVPSVITILNNQPLRIVAGLLGLLVGRNDIVAVAKSRAGVAFLTILLSRAELLKQEAASKGETSETQDLSSWSQTYNALFARLSGQWPSLFPSTRASARLPPGSGQLLIHKRPDIDGEDQAVWQLLAAVAVSADTQQQQSLVSEVRDKVLENVFAAKRKTVDPITGERKIRNVDLLLNALGLSSSQIQMDE